MTHEVAMKLSAALIEAAISHTVFVGWHEDMHPQVQCRVDLPIPRRYSGGVSEAVRAIEVIGETLGLELATSFMGDGLTFSTPTPGELLQRAGQSRGET